MGDSNVHILKGQTTLPIPVDRVLDAEAARKLDKVLLIGFDTAGELYIAASWANAPELLFALERSKQVLLRRFRGDCADG